MPEGCHSALHQDPMGEECSPLRSPLSASEQPPACMDTRPDSCPRLRGGAPEGPGRRPVSLVSTLSSDSSLGGHSLSGSTAALSPPSSSSSSSSSCTVTPSVPSHEEDLDLQLNASQGSTVSQGSPGGQWGEQQGLVVWGYHFHVERTSGRTEGGEGGGGGAPHIQSTPVAADAMAPNPELSYVDRVVMEIIETERMYVQDLRSIVEDYLAKIIDARELPILPEQVCALFGNIDEIYVFNSELLQSLDLCENDPVAIARCFVDQSEYFVIYTQYCTNYPNSVAALTECMRNKTLAKFFSDRQASLNRSLPLGSYLLKPVQRILKYHLLLEEIARHYDPEAMGYEVIQEAIDTMTAVAWYINDMKRRHEHAVRLQEIQSLLINWKGPDLTTYGELVLEGSFHVQRAKNSRTLFLFQKMLLITKKRGEHYVCKTHISCSTLMLLDSAKDPLVFSVIHFKHPRHLHTVQAKSVEEKRLWAHHIKRLIQENHNAIPQRERETILEMDYLSPRRYRYSPERMKKAESCQSEDFPVSGRTERRRSEPVRHTIRSTKGFLKHADSESTLLGDLCSLQPASSVSTLASSVGEPQAEGPGAEEEQEQDEQQQEEDEEEVEETSPKRPSLEQLSPSDAAPKRGSAPREEELEERATQPQQLEEEEEEEKEKEVKQEDVQNTDAAEEKDPVGDLLPCEKAEEVSLDGQVNTEDVCDPPCLTEPEVDTTPTEMIQSQTPDPPSSPVPPPDTQPHQHQKQLDEGTENGEEKEAESDSSCLPAEDGSILSLGEYSEEDEEMLTDHKSIPPSPSPSPTSDEAATLAEDLGSRGSRRTSLGGSEDPCCQASPSPQAESPQPSLEPSVCSDSQEEAPIASSDPRAEPVSPSLPEVAQEEEAQCASKRRSTLSKQDRLLIHKIRRYYEHQDTCSSIKRRESLSYIPAGLVQHMSRQLNGAPQGTPAPPLYRKGSSASRPTSWSVFDLPGVDKNQGVESVPKPKPRHQRTPEAIDGSAADEEFKPSTEMLHVWNHMEMGMNGHTHSEGEDPTDHSPEENPVSRPVGPDVLAGGTGERSLHTLEECETEHVSKRSPVSPPPTESETERAAEESWASTAPGCRGIARETRAPLPRIISLRSGMEDDQILQDMGKMKNKVFQLARQYSQRIKNNRPAVRQRLSRDPDHLLHGLKSMPAVHEESGTSRDTGEHNLTCPLNTHDQVNANGDLPTLASSSDPGPRSRETTPSYPSPSPSPGIPSSPVEPAAFRWPDVHRLRSRYAGRATQGQGGHGHRERWQRREPKAAQCLQEVCCPAWR